MSEQLNLLDLPDEVLENVLSYFSYDEIAKYRLVCKKFDATCGNILNRGFFQMERRHATILKKVRSLLPRRESERRVHHLARHCDILSAIETRINMLDMTFLKYIEVGACCFIPGKVIDEVLEILKMVENTNSPPRVHEVLQELRDISSMAMEYFDEKIAPNLKCRRPMPLQEMSMPGPSTYNAAEISPVLAKDNLRKDLLEVKSRTKRHNITIKLLKSLIARLASKVQRQSQKINAQTQKIREQNVTIRDQNNTLTELKKQVDEWDLKFAELAAKVNRSREETNQQNAIPSTSTQPTNQQNLLIRNRSYSPPRILNLKPNIKPRISQIAPTSIIVNNLIENERKRKSENLLRNPASPIPPKISRIQRSDDNSNETNLALQNFNIFPKLPLFLSSSLETLIKNPITSLKARKRKMQ